MDEKTRIEEVLKHSEMNARQFASAIDLNTSTLSHVLSGRNNPSLDIMQRILKTFPNINPAWLILGEGSMFRKKNDSQMLSLFDEESETTFESEPFVVKKEEKTSEPIESLQKKREENDVITQNSALSSTPLAENIPLPQVKEQNHPISHISSKSISKIIVYFSDHTFQEFEGKS